MGLNMPSFFEFGECHAAYPVRVINEREARAGAGILFFIAFVAFMNAWLVGNYRPTQTVVLGFFADFFIRVLVNPRLAPSLILGRLAVRHQQPEYVGAPQKRFAWALGLVLASFMSVLVVFNHLRGPINMVVCTLCLVLLFFEAAFGICLGCRLYALFNKEGAQLCPGGVCERHERQSIQQVSWVQHGAAVIFGMAWWASTHLLNLMAPTDASHATSQKSTATPSVQDEERCRVPEFAKQIGHEERWKLHNGCL